MEIHCIVETNIPENISDHIDQNRFICIRLRLRSDNNEYNTLFMQNFLSEWERKIFDPKIRRIREVIATKKNLKLSNYKTTKRSSTTIQRLLTNTINATMYIPWIHDYNNDSAWNDTNDNITFPNITIISTKSKDKLIFGYFRLYALILLAILIILLFVITVITCYYDCENRRSHLLGDKYDSIKKDAVPIVAVRYEGRQPDIIDKTRDDITQESSVNSRTLRKRQLLIEALRSGSTKSVTCSEFGNIFI
ncbi:unnamed protein product [Cercopithifilaria johnstoni]|uniref:Uncharacterized protein n=1 Tax=Cercopithifilaria johnstoni TaxID=2874296 RepID=A0A8J2M5D1_9BILA|nr:unnamed protein product [Cercopithifilaria johnstoni]